MLRSWSSVRDGLLVERTVYAQRLGLIAILARVVLRHSKRRILGEFLLDGLLQLQDVKAAVCCLP